MLAAKIGDVWPPMVTCHAWPLPTPGVVRHVMEDVVDWNVAMAQVAVGW